METEITKQTISSISHTKLRAGFCRQPAYPARPIHLTATRLASIRMKPRTFASFEDCRGMTSGLVYEDDYEAGR